MMTPITTNDPLRIECDGKTILNLVAVPTRDSRGRSRTRYYIHSDTPVNIGRMKDADRSLFHDHIRSQFNQKPD